MILRDVGAITLDLPIEDTAIYPDIKKGKTRTQSSDLNKGKNGLLASEFTVLCLTEKFVSTPEYDAEMLRNEHIIEKVRKER